MFNNTRLVAALLRDSNTRAKIAFEQNAPPLFAAAEGLVNAARRVIRKQCSAVDRSPSRGVGIAALQIARQAGEARPVRPIYEFRFPALLNLLREEVLVMGGGY